MSETIEFPLLGGGTVAVEVRPGTSGRVTRGGVAETISKATRSFEDAVSVVEPIAAALVSKLRNIEDGAESVDLKFGLKFSAEAGVVIAAASTEANIEIRISWHRSRQGAK
jgi:hypothetical protein